MYSVPVSGVLYDPVAIRRQRQSDRSETVQYVSGSVLRGALAGCYLRRYGQVDKTFRKLFVSGECRFGCLDPDEHLAPVTAMACKRGGSSHRLWDSLWERMVASLRGFPFDQSRQRLWRCSVCDSDMKPLDGYFYHYSGNRLEQRQRLLTLSFMHVGIDRVRGSAAEQILYSIEALGPERPGSGPSLLGRLRLRDPDMAARLKELLDEPVYFGYHRSSGYGQCRLVLGEPKEARIDRDRLVEWSERFIAYARGVDSALDIDSAKDFFFSIGLPNGAIVIDPFLRYSLDLADAIEWLPPLPDVRAAEPGGGQPVAFADGELRCLVARTRHELVRGWNVAHGMPKPDEYAIDRGAVYAYHYRGGPAGRDELLHRLEELVERGLGLRVAEGFGEVVVSDQFHARGHGPREGSDASS